MIRVVNNTRFQGNSSERKLIINTNKMIFNSVVKQIIKDFSEKECPEECPDCYIVITGSRLENLKVESPECDQISVDIKIDH